MHPALLEAADRLQQALKHGTPCSPVRDLIAQVAGDHESANLVQLAYAVQQHNTETAIAAGDRLVGHKIGLTSRAVQQQLGVDQPDFGALLASNWRADNLPIAWADTQQPKVEAEIALVLEHDLLHERHTLADILRASAFALPAIEIVGSRIHNWDIQLADTIADNASSGLFVLGSQPRALNKVDWVRCGMHMNLKGEPVSVGAGAACMGNPLNAAVWLADTLVAMGTPLRAGDIVLTGALGPMVAANPGDVFTAHIQGLGSVTAMFDLADQ
ncbi:fumarylacetoacetate hydrolase family protein [Ectopseudomonas mendocina]|uniref:Fumarylacetoacetate hydrolase family protein n=1 Tax=Ectopseudomonas mendocina TaxID=300 RepID=A0ABZ2RT57_ECTME